MDRDFWFTKKQKQFLKNIDTFYYSVYISNDVTSSSTDPYVYDFRCFLDSLKGFLEPVDYTFNDYHVIYMPGRFSIYNFRFSVPDYFDFFVAPFVNTKDTPIAILQLRSRVLWEDGIYSAVDDSLKFVNKFFWHFGIEIKEVRENRCDFACHSNYLSDPEKFFNPEHFAKMWVGAVGRVDREKVKHFFSHYTVYYDDSIETDYISIGKRSDKCFIRIYLKTKEVVQEGYKGFFLKLWQLSGLISRYDLYCLEEAYKRKSWVYVDVARLRWVYDNDDLLDDDKKKYIKSLIDDNKADINEIHLAAKLYSEPVTKIFNVEFQCMRDMSKSFQLIPKNQGVYARVYDYLDNYSLIYEYLTRVSLRLVRTDQIDNNKSRRDNNTFWERLRNAKTVDFKKKHKDISLIRKYSSNINLDLRKKRAVNALTSFGFAYNKNPESPITEDITTLVSVLNDNDLAYIDKRKQFLASTYKEDLPDELKRYRCSCFLFDPENNIFY